MTEKKVADYIINTIDNIYADTKRITSGNVSHMLPCLLHDIRALRNNIILLISQNTKLSIETLDKLVRKTNENRYNRF